MAIVEYRLAESNIKTTDDSVSGSTTWHVLDNSNRSDALSMCDGFIINIGDYYKDAQTGHIDYGAFVKSINAKPDGFRRGLFAWIVTVEYGPEEDTPEDDKSEYDSQSICATSEYLEVACSADYDGQWNVNSAGDFFENALISEQAVRVFRWKRKENYNPERWILSFERTINGYPIWGCPEATLFCRSITTSQEARSYDPWGLLQERSWEVEYEIAYNPNGWLLDLVDQGFRAWQEIAGAEDVESNVESNVESLEVIRNDDGSPKDVPTLLDGYGKILAPGADPIVRQYRMREYSDFSQLRLRDPFI